MSLIPLGIWAASGAGGVNYWISLLGGAGSDIGYSIATDSDNNSYVHGITGSTGAGADDFLVAKYDSVGAIQWQRTLGDSITNIGKSIAIDTSDNIFIAGETGTYPDHDFVIARYNTAGAIQWQRVFGGTNYDITKSIAVDSSSNVYVVGESVSVDLSTIAVLLVKYNSSGTLQWQKSLNGAGNDSGLSVKTDSSGNVYVLGITNTSGAGDNDFLLVKYDSSGAVQWQRTLGGASFEDGNSLVIDSLDNIYCFGLTFSTGAGARDYLLAKYNSSGTIQWQRTLGGASQDWGFSVTADSSDFIYVAGYSSSTGAGSNDMLFAKYDSSGTIQWQRTLGSTGNDQAWAIKTDSSDSLYVLGNTSAAGAGSNDLLFTKLPNDGSLTGTYLLDGVNFVYAASSLTASTSSLTAGTSSLTAATPSFTSATSTLTDSSSSLTSHLVEL